MKELMMRKYRASDQWRIAQIPRDMTDSVEPGVKSGAQQTHLRKAR